MYASANKINAGGASVYMYVKHLYQRGWTEGMSTDDDRSSIDG